MVIAAQYAERDGKTYFGVDSWIEAARLATIGNGETLLSLELVVRDDGPGTARMLQDIADAHRRSS